MRKRAGVVHPRVAAHSRQDANRQPHDPRQNYRHDGDLSGDGESPGYDVPDREVLPEGVAQVSLGYLAHPLGVLQPEGVGKAERLPKLVLLLLGEDVDAVFSEYYGQRVPGDHPHGQEYNQRHAEKRRYREQQSADYVLLHSGYRSLVESTRHRHGEGHSLIQGLRFCRECTASCRHESRCGPTPAPPRTRLRRARACYMLNGQKSSWVEPRGRRQQPPPSLDSATFATLLTTLTADP